MIQEFTAEVEKTARAVLDDVHTAIPGEVLSFDEKTSLVTVKPVGKFVTSDGKVLEYPVLSDIPVVFPYCQKGNIGIAFPICVGDSCLIIVSEVELDEWMNGSESEGSLRFDLTSAVVIPGLVKIGNKLLEKAAKEQAVVIAASETEVKISKGSATITKGSTFFCVSESGISVRGDLVVEGNISYTGETKRL